MDIEKIGRFIAVHRKKLGYTQKQLGEIVNVSGKAVSKWERGLCLPDITLFNKIAVALKVSVAQMLSGCVEGAFLSSYPLSAEASEDGSGFAEPYRIDWAEETGHGLVSPYLYGNNLEHTRSCISGGLSAQMLRNRKFSGKPSPMEGVASEWFLIGERTFCTFIVPYAHHDSEHYHMNRSLESHALRILCCENGVEGGIGQHGLCIEGGKSYEFAIVAKSERDLPLTVRLTDRKGERLYAAREITVRGAEEWERYSFVFSPDADDADADLRIVCDEQVPLHIGCLSLMDHNNFRGMRKDVIEAMKQLGITVLRWPGGNFAGEYNWFDGLLPVDERAPFESYLRLETQPHTLGYDSHDINTDDFIALCREIGAQPYITVNLTWNTPEENAAWVEYCNGDSSTKYGKLRAERGYAEPYNVSFWSLGNEMGYGHMEGDNTAAGYSHLAKETGKKMLEVCDWLTLCSSGPYPDEEWIAYSAKPLSAIAPLVSSHYYGAAISYKSIAEMPAECEKCLSGVRTTREQIRRLQSMLDANQGISFDEWNIWASWFRPSSVVHGIYSALMMHMFIAESQRSSLHIVCHFEAVNESAIKVTPQAAVLTATGEMLKLMKIHCGASLLFADDFAVVTENSGVISITLINYSCEHEQKFSGKYIGACIKSEVFEGNTLLPLTNFEKRNLSVVLREGTFETVLAPLSVAVLQFEKR